MQTKQELVKAATNRIWDEFNKDQILATLDYVWHEAFMRGYDHAIDEVQSGAIVINKEKYHRTLRRS